MFQALNPAEPCQTWMLRALTCLISVNSRELSAYLRMECNYFTCSVELVLPPPPPPDLKPENLLTDGATWTLNPYHKKTSMHRWISTLTDDQPIHVDMPLTWVVRRSIFLSLQLAQPTIWPCAASHHRFL